jgi:DNA-binding MarR family transcriptional regulator
MELTPVQGLVLLILEPHQTKSMNELSDTLGCDASNTTGLVDRLEAQKLVDRTAFDKDRRIKQIQLSKKGQKNRQELLGLLKESELLDMSKLSADERNDLDRLIRKLLS